MRTAVRFNCLTALSAALWWHIDYNLHFYKAVETVEMLCDAFVFCSCRRLHVV